MIEIANKLARKFGYSGAKDCDMLFENKHVFVAFFDEVTYTGLPQFILVSEGKEADFAMPLYNEKIFAQYARSRH